MKPLNSIKFIFLLLSFLLAFALVSSAQLVIPEVTVDFQRLPAEAQTKLANLDSVIVKYLRDQEWAEDEYNYDFPIQISVYFTDYTADPQEDKFKAKLIATNKQDARFEDTRWEFGIRLPLESQFKPGQYNPCSGVIDFYVWMLLGLEFDKLEKLGGRKYYDKARQKFLESTGSIHYFGWDKRKELLDAQLDKANDTARELNFFYYTGIYYDGINNFVSSKDYLYYALVKLDKVSSDIQSRFLEVNHRQFAEALVRAGYVKGVEALEKLDPVRKSVYEEIVQPPKDK